MKKIILVLATVLLLIVLWVIFTRINVFPMADFLEYWASGRLNLTGGNPYDAGQMLNIEKPTGWMEADALMMLNPPWVLPYGMFFGLFEYPFSRFLGFIIHLGIVFTSSVFLWRHYQGSKQGEWKAWLIVLTFAPMLHALKSGQVTILVFLGAVGFLYLIHRKLDFWAGAAASLVLAKPHLLYLFVLALIIWSLTQKRYLVLVGMAAALAVSTGIAWAANPQVISQYLLMLKTYPLELWMTTTLGAYMRVILSPEKFYLQYIPSILAAAWYILVWARRSKDIDWTTHLPLVIPISIATSPYGWTLDSMLVAISILQLAVLFEFRQWTATKILIISAYWVTNLMVAFLRFNQNWFWWYPIFLLVWYILSYRHLTRQRVFGQDPASSVSQGLE